MASAFNTPQCVTVNTNIGKPSCDTILASIRYAILLPKNHEFSDANVADITAALQALTLNPVGTRAYPLANFIDFKDDSTEDTFNETAFGYKQKSKKGKYLFTFGLDGVGQYYWKKLRNFDQSSNYDVVFVDENNVVVAKSSSTSGYPAKGIPLSQLNVKPVKINDGSNATKYEVQFELDDQSDLNENLYLIYPEEDVKSSVKGLIDVVLTQGSSPTSGHLFVKANEEITGTDLGTIYPTELADPDAWVVIVDSTGLPATVSAVSYSSTNGYFNLSTTATGNLTVSLATPAALAVLGIGGSPNEGYESNTLAQTGV